MTAVLGHSGVGCCKPKGASRASEHAEDRILLGLGGCSLEGAVGICSSVLEEQQQQHAAGTAAAADGLATVLVMTVMQQQRCCFATQLQLAVNVV